MRQLRIVFCVAVLLLYLVYPAISLAQTVPVLLYHRLGYTSTPLYLSPERFENQLKALKEAGYTSLSLRQYTDYMTGATDDLPEKPLLITFDDGNADNYDIAFPLLKQYGFTATFFVPTALLDQEARITSSQLLEMHLAGMSFGSHTATHKRLTQLDKTDLAKELGQSKQTLEELLHKPVESIAYPGGSYDDTVLSIVKSSGYKIGFITLSGRNSRSTPSLLMRRIPVFSYSPHILWLIENGT